MQSDDLYPSDGTFMGGVPTEPKEQALERIKERAQAVEKDTILKDLLARWETKIKFYESVRAIPEEVKLNPEDFMRIIAANAVVVEILEGEKEYIKSLIR